MTGPKDLGQERMSDTRLAEKRSEGAPPETKRPRLSKRVLDELLSVTPAWICFTLLFSLLWLTKAVILRAHHLHVPSMSRVFLGSILVAKGLLLVDMIPFIRGLEKKPALLTAFWKTWFYFAALFFFQYLDTLFDRRHEGLAAGNRAFVHSLSLAFFWVLQLWIVISLFLFSAIRTLVHKLGRERSRELLIGR
jgi:hypothetical protein